MSAMPSDPDQFAAAVRAECDAVANMLIEKNAAYGNSVLDPVRVLSKANPGEQIRVRLDDKLSRLAWGTDAGEDVIPKRRANGVAHTMTRKDISRAAA